MTLWRPEEEGDDGDDALPLFDREASKLTRRTVGVQTMHAAFD